MTVSASMLLHLAQNVTFLVPVWSITPSNSSAIITPASVVGGTFAGNTFTKTAGAGWGNSGFSSVESLTGNGFIQWTVTEINKDRMVGLSTSDPNQDFTSIGFAINHDAAGLMQIYESGVSRGNFGAIVANTTVMKIERIGTTLTYYKDGVAQRVVTGVSTATLFADTAVNGTSGTIGPITLGLPIAAYAAHTRDIGFGGVHYKASPVESTRFSQTLGVASANNVELHGVFDDVVNEADLQGGKWKNAKVVFEYISYDPATGLASATVTGSVAKMKGQVGKVSVNNGTYMLELRSLSDLLQQEIGSLTSPLDRNRNPEALGVAMGPFTFARTVTAVADKRNFTVGGTAQATDYFKYGRSEWVTGANKGLKMEIKANAGNVIELQLPMRSTIVIGDTLNLIAGYDSTREQCRDKFNAMDEFDGEPDLPGLAKGVLSYPE